MFGAGDGKAKIRYFPAVLTLEDIGWLQVAVNDVFFHEILNPTDDLGHYVDGCHLLNSSVFGEEAEEIPVTAVLGDDVAVGGSSVDIVAFYDVGMVEGP